MKKYKQEPKEPGTNRRMLENALAAWELPMIDIKDAMAVERRISDYLKHCMENDRVPSVAGCANWLRVGIPTLESWHTGRTGSPEHQRIVNAFYTTMQELWADDMREGNINPVSGIFMGKVFYGYKETQEIVVNTNAQIEVSTADLIEQSKLLPGAEMLALPSSTPEKSVIPAIIDEPQKEVVDKPLTEDEMLDAEEAAIVIPPSPILEELNYTDDPYYTRAVKKKPHKSTEKHTTKQ